MTTARLLTLVLLAALATAVACSSSTSDSAASPRMYTEPFGELWEAANSALERAGLEVIGENHSQGLVVAMYDAGPGFGKAEVGFIITRPRGGNPTNAWEVSVSSTLPPGATGGQGWETIMKDLERELMGNFRSALGARRFSAEGASRMGTPTPNPRFPR